MLDFTPAAPTLREISRYQKSTELPFQRLVKEIARVTTLIDYRRAELNNEDDHDDFPELEVRAHVPSVPPLGQRLWRVHPASEEFASEGSRGAAAMWAATIDQLREKLVGVSKQVKKYIFSVPLSAGSAPGGTLL